MPHIIFEYSSDLNEKIDIQPLLQDVHNTLADQGVDKSRIKTRAVSLPYYVVGDHGANGPMVHITILLLAGRDNETKKKYSHPIHQLVTSELAKVIPEAAVTLEVRDMDPENYIL